ncbi:MAG: hypothetical protein QXR44_05465 [Thermoproteota archaeon]
MAYRISEGKYLLPAIAEAYQRSYSKPNTISNTKVHPIRDDIACSKSRPSCRKLSLSCFFNSISSALLIIE